MQTTGYKTSDLACGIIRVVLAKLTTLGEVTMLDTQGFTNGLHATSENRTSARDVETPAKGNTSGQALDTNTSATQTIGYAFALPAIAKWTMKTL
jgi:hypothetical protein